MDKNLIFNILSLLILITGIVTLITSIFKPSSLYRITVNEKSKTIKDKEVFIKHAKKLYIIFGLLCCIFSILSLLNIIGDTFFSLSLSWLAMSIGIANSKLLNKFSQNIKDV